MQKILIVAGFLKVLNINYTIASRNMSLKAPKTLEEFGYAFNEEGKLRKLNKITGKLGEEGFDFNISNDPVKNQRNYEALGETITEHVYELLEQNGMHKIYLPGNLPKDECTFIFTSMEKLFQPKKLLVLIHGSGVVRAGQWARSLIINQSLDHGSQIPYIKRARELGYEILITNTNDNFRTINGVEKAIPGHSSPTEHAANVWQEYVIGCDPESVAIVAHSYGGVVTLDLARRFPEFFKNKVFAVGLTDSVHSMSLASTEVRDLLKIGRNWVTSSKPLDQEISKNENDIPRHSAGHTKHEWTSYSCMSALFDFFERRHHDFLQTRNVKKPKLDL